MIKGGGDVESSRVKARRVARPCVAVLVRLVRPCPPFILEQQKAVYVLLRVQYSTIIKSYPGK